MTVDCSALVPTLVESELFGHVPGAFTDARESAPGILREAQGGTLFLDEVGDLPLEAQVKLLRAIQEREVRPVGGLRSVHLDYRVISATNRDLGSMVRKGAFRMDLYYRLVVVEVDVPPVRCRNMDIPALLEHFLAEACEEPREESVRRENWPVLLAYAWPGNVRELQNFAHRVLAIGEQEAMDDLGLRPSKFTMPTNDSLREHEEELLNAVQARARITDDTARTRDASKAGLEQLGRKVLLSVTR